MLEGHPDVEFGRYNCINTMSVTATAKQALRLRPAWRASRGVLRPLATASLAAVVAGSLAASASLKEPVRSTVALVVAPHVTDDQAAITRAAANLMAQYAGNPAALRGLGSTGLAGGRNDATVATFLKLRWIGRVGPRLEQYAAKLDAVHPDELALAVAGVQHYSELIHRALLLDGPPHLVIVSLSGQRLTAYDHGQIVVNTLVTTGRPALPTDVGAMHVWKKDSPWTMKSPWPKGSPDWYPDTQVQMVAWFSTTGEGMHDASWQPPGTYGPGSQTGPYASHGCIHVPPAAESTLFSWVEIGTPVVVIPGDGSPLSAQVAQQSVDAMGNPITGTRGD